MSPCEKWKRQPVGDLVATHISGFYGVRKLWSVVDKQDFCLDHTALCQVEYAVLSPSRWLKLEAYNNPQNCPTNLVFQFPFCKLWGSISISKSWFFMTFSWKSLSPWFLHLSFLSFFNSVSFPRQLLWINATQLKAGGVLSRVSVPNHLKHSWERKSGNRPSKIWSPKRGPKYVEVQVSQVHIFSIQISSYGSPHNISPLRRATTKTQWSVSLRWFRRRLSPWKRIEKLADMSRLDRCKLCTNFDPILCLKFNIVEYIRLIVMENPFKCMLHRNDFHLNVCVQCFLIT